MAGFLSALGWAAPAIAGTSLTQQDYQNQQQRFATEQGFGNMINSLGPEYEPFKQWYKQAGPGASHDIAAAMGGKLGDIFRQQAAASQLAGVWNDPTTSPEQKLAKAAAIDPEYGKYFGELAVQQAKAGFGFKPSGKLSDFLNVHGITPEDWANMSKEDKEKLGQEFEAGGPGDTVLKPIYSPPGHPGKTMYEYVKKSGPAGTFAGEVRPLATGANPAGEMAATEDSLKQLGQTIDDAGLGDSTSPMTMTELKLKAKGWLGIPDPMEQSILGQISLLQYTLTGIALKGWGSRNPQYANELINYHIPQAGEPPVMIKQKIHDWMKSGGFLDKYRKTLGLPVGGETGGMGGGGGEEMPPSSVTPEGSEGEDSEDGGGSDEDWIGRASR